MDNRPYSHMLRGDTNIGADGCHGRVVGMVPDCKNSMLQKAGCDGGTICSCCGMDWMNPIDAMMADRPKSVL